MNAVSDETLWSIVTQVWESLLGAEAVPCPPAPAADPVLTASVRVSGEWSGLVAVTAGNGTAERMARRMLRLPEDRPVDPADVEDALGEVVNVVGGNVKALLADGHRLGLPETRPGTDPAAGPVLSRVSVGWGEDAVEVAVRERTDVPAWTVSSEVEAAVSEEQNR